MPERTCSIPDCARPRFARGWCQMHYTRWVRHGDPLFVRPLPPIGDSKRCHGCGETKPLTDYHINRATRDGRTTQCAECQRAKALAYHFANRDKTTAKMKALGASRRRFIQSIKVTAGCIDCGTSEGQLDFDHRDPATKSFDVSKLAGSLSLPKLLEEIAKCDVRCSPCHKDRHRESQGALAASLPRKNGRFARATGNQA